MPSKDPSTIADIAERAGVSISTVSRVLSGKVNVSKPKRKAVLEAVAELDYQPNVFARGLASGQSMVIGVLTQNFGSPFYDGILQGIVQGLDGTGYFPIFADGQWQPDVERSVVLAMMQRKIDGLIVIGGFLAAGQLKQWADEVPVVVAARHLPGFEAHCIYVDNIQAAAMATQHLLEVGHRQIAHISGPPNHQDAVERKQGYLQALKKSGTEAKSDLIIEGTFRRQSGLLAVEMLLSRGHAFSAIFAANDQMAYGVRLALYRRGIRVPEDISLVGFDDEPAAAFMIPPLTTVRQPAVEIGLAAAQSILARLKGKPVTQPELKAELMVRESTAIHR